MTAPIFQIIHELSVIIVDAGPVEAERLGIVNGVFAPGSFEENLNGAFQRGGH